MIEENLDLINQKIKNVCQNNNINPAKINLVAVSKKQSQASIIKAINSGVKIFGENYLQEAKDKWVELKKLYPNIKLHFIGHLQSNKVKEVLALFDVIETLDNEKLALTLKKFLNNQDFFNTSPEIFIQIKLGNEQSKSGINPLHAPDFINFVKHDCQLNLTGLMGIPPLDEPSAPYFSLLAQLAREHNLPNLSMGMSADYETAISLEANYIRLGTAIFGARI